MIDDNDKRSPILAGDHDAEIDKLLDREQQKARDRGHVFDSDWPDLQQPDEPREAPPFPIEVLPPALCDYAVALAKATQTPVDWSSIVALGAVATAVQRRYLVQPHDHWSPQPTGLYAAIVSPPGTRKSAIFGAASEPLRDHERELARAWRRRHGDEAESFRDAAKKRLRDATKALSKSQGTDREAAEEAVRVARMEAAKLVERPEPRLIFDDAGIEALGEALHAQGGSLAVWSAEGSALENALGRYSKNGRASPEVYLQAHAGDAIVVDRVGKEGRKLRVARPSLTWIATMQPGPMAEIVGDKMLRGRGLVARIVWCVAPHGLGSRKGEPPPVPAEVVQRYRSRISELLAGEDDRDDDEVLVRRVVRFDQEAKRGLVALHAWLEPQLADDGAVVELRDWAAKWLGLVARVAALLAVERSASQVSVDDLDAATEIGRWALGHAQAVLDPKPTAHPAVRALVQRIRQGLVEDGATLRSLYTRGWVALDRAGLLRGIDVLEPLGWVRVAREDTGGRPRDVLRLHPQLRPDRDQKMIC